MKIAFTICSNNYLAHAKTLGDSFLNFHPDVKFIIGLVDQYNPEMDYDFFSAFELIPVADISVPGFEELNHKYNITELNTAVKPSYLHYIFKKYDAEKVLYIDPDILVTSSFEEVFDALDSKDIILTPHMCSPVDDGFSPTDYEVLAGGVYNLGFIGLSNYNRIIPFINWWHDRVVKYGFNDFRRAMFYDQLWIHYVPCFYENYHILKHLGYNMANWNLHERIITSQENGHYMINDKYALRFFHFSSFKFNKPEMISAYHSRYDFNSRPDLLPIFSTYVAKLKQNRVDQISKLKVFYYPELSLTPKPFQQQSIFRKSAGRMKRALNVLLTGHE